MNEPSGDLERLETQDGAESQPPHIKGAEDAFYERYPALEGVPGHIIRKAWFSISHLLLPSGARVADMGCTDGAMTYAMAVMNPHLHFIGLERDRKKITKARNHYEAPNLEFQVGDIAENTGFEPGSLDAIINSFTLHEVYSESRYNDRQVARALDYQFTLLKQDGLMFIRDYALSYPGEYVLMEMPDGITGSNDVNKMSETELLIWFSNNARPREAFGGHGFFLEELPSRFPKTRLFRVPYKWAYEFIIRKDDRAALQAELHKEYIYFTQRDFRKNLRMLGGRDVYSSPHYDDSIISKRFDGHFRMYDDNGNNMGPPPTSFIAVAQKTGERKSLRLQERRPSSNQAQSLRVQTMRNDKTGRMADIVSRDLALTEILPYYVTGDNKLQVFVHESMPRGIVNAVPRNGREIDGKNWSGHMVEAISVPSDIIQSIDPQDIKQTVRFAQAHLGLKPAIESYLEAGRSYYPAPDFIDDLIKTSYLRVQENTGIIEPKNITSDISGFTTQGKIRAVNAQSLLDAIAVGLIPNARLELQIMHLCDKLGIEVMTWEECPLVLEESEPDLMFNGQDFVKMKSFNDTRFKNVRGNAGQLRAVQSIFVDEGVIDGGMSGLAARDMEFIIPDDKTLNKAVILPLTRNSGKVMVGVEIDYMPIPQRHEGNGLTLRAPSVNLPKDITNIYQARNYVAELFKVPPENVWRLGESYFCHSGITPMRIFPFAVATKGRKESPIGGPINFAPMKYIWNVIDYAITAGQDLDLLSKMNKVQRRMSAAESDLGLRRAAGQNSQMDNDGPGVNIVSLSSVSSSSSASSSSITSAVSDASLSLNLPPEKLKTPSVK